MSAIAEYAKVMEPLSKDNTIILTKLEFKKMGNIYCVNLYRGADKKSIITSKQRRKNYRKNLIILSI